MGGARGVRTHGAVLDGATVMCTEAMLCAPGRHDTAAPVSRASAAERRAHVSCPCENLVIAPCNLKQSATATIVAGCVAKRDVLIASFESGLGSGRPDPQNSDSRNDIGD
eukprot:282741-Prymnesium_polylepis.1